MIDVVTALTNTMHAHQICVGLAAPQIGSDFRIAVINLKNGDSTDLILINPTIIWMSESKEFRYESCMSLPGWRGKVERSKNVRLQWSDLSGEMQVGQFDGFMARAIIHEIDHLDGIMFDMRDHSIKLEKTDLFDDYLSS